MKKAISKIVDQALGNINDSIVKRTATESLARVAMHTKQQSNPSPPVYDTSSYNEQQYATSTTGPADATLAQGSGYTSLADNGNLSMSYNLGTQIPVNQQTTTYEQQPYLKVDEDTSMNTSQAAALVTATSSQPPHNAYAYPQSLPQVSSTHQPTYVANNYSPQDWRQWTQTYMQQPVGPQGEYLNTATTLMALGGRDGSNEGAGHGGHTQHIEQAHLGQYHWPGVAFPGAANGGHHQ